MATLSVTITESVTLNGAARGSTNSLSITGVDDIYHRIVTVPAGSTDLTLVAFTSSMENRDGALDRDLVKYIRVTNLDSSNPVILNMQQREDENASAVGDQNLGLLLSAGKSYIMGEAKECIDVEGGANDIAALTDLHDLESIMVDPLAAEVKVEVFIALVV
jgi:hypothetical protein